MSTSTKSPSTIRQGGPGSSHENAKAPLEVKKPAADYEEGGHGARSRGDQSHTKARQPGNKVPPTGRNRGD